MPETSPFTIWRDTDNPYMRIEYLGNVFSLSDELALALASKIRVTILTPANPVTALDNVAATLEAAAAKAPLDIRWAGKPPRSNTKWTQERTDKLTRDYLAGKRIAFIADELGISHVAVRSQLYRLGIANRNAKPARRKVAA